MVTIGALEAIRTGTTTIVENSGGIGRSRGGAGADRPALRVRGVDPRQRERRRARCRRKGSPGARRPGSRPSCETRACSASTTCSPPGTARSRDASACSRPPRSPKPRRPSCCRPSAPSPRSTISDTRSTCPRAAPKSSSWCGTMAFVRRRFSTRHGFLGPRLFAAHCRYVDDADIALLGKLGHDHFAPGGDGREPRRHPAHPSAARGGLPDRQRHRQQHQRPVRGDAGRAADRTHLARRCVPRRPAAAGRHARRRHAGRRASRAAGEAASARSRSGRRPTSSSLDTLRAHLVPAGRIVSAWIHNGQPSDIESVMVDGQFVMRNRKVLTMDEDRIVAEADKVGRRIWDQVQAAGPIPIPGRSRSR